MTCWEIDLLQALTGPLRMVSLEQAARLGWPTQQRALRNAREAVRRLLHGGWLEQQRVLSRPVQPLSTPLTDWRPGAAPPPFAPLSRRLRRRARTAARRMVIYTAAPRARRHFGVQSARCSMKLCQMTHDLHVVEIWLNYRQQGYDMTRWNSEDHLNPSWPARQRPDAVWLDKRGRFTRAIEYGGGYSVSRLCALHQALCDMNLPYELW